MSSDHTKENPRNIHDEEVAEVMTELAEEYMPGVRWIEVES